MNQIIPSIIISLALVFPAFSTTGAQDREPQRATVLDEIITVHDDIVWDIPDIARWCDRLGLEGKRMNIGNAELYVETEGDGTPMVLLHGGPGGTHHYFHPHFSRAADFAQVIYYDQRGCGRSDYQPGEGYTIRQAADDLEQLRQALGIHRWVVVGYSYGGLLGQLYATKYPESLAGLVLVSSALSPYVELEPTRQYNFISQEEQQRMREINQNPELTSEQRMFNRYLNGDWKRQFFYRPTRERLAEMARYEWIHDSAFRQSIIESMLPVDLEGAFRHFPVPTLIMEGKWDLTWNTDKPNVLHNNHPNAEMVMFDQSGHSPFEDEPEEFFSVLGHFVQSLQEVREENITKWNAYLVQWQEDEVATRQQSPDYVIRTTGWGKSSSKRISSTISADDIAELTSVQHLTRVGFAFYDVKDYEKALLAFRKIEELAKTGPDSQQDSDLSMSLIWQGHMLDLLDQRSQAVDAYEQVVDIASDRHMTFSLYGLSFVPADYASERIEKPFERIENMIDF